MNKNIIKATLIIVALMANSAFAANCITQKRGVSIMWHGNGGYLHFSNVHKMTKTFAVTVALNSRGNTIYSGVPANGQKISIPKGTKDVILNIAKGQGKVCYSR